MSNEVNCKTCGTAFDPETVKEKLGEVWWLGLFCSLACFEINNAIPDEVEINPDTLGDIEGLLEREKLDLASGRSTTRWDNIGGKLDLGLSLVEDEAKTKAMERGLPVSSHEGYGLIAEEVAELLDAIRSNDHKAILTEAVQVAAAGLVLVGTLILWEPKEIPPQTLEAMRDKEISEVADTLAACGLSVPRETIERWSFLQRVKVKEYAETLYFKQSADAVEVPPTPEELTDVILKTKTDRDSPL